MTLPPCPKCGDTDSGFYTKGRAYGPVEIYYTESGDYEETFTDHVHEMPGRVVYCGSCNKPRRDLQVTRLRVTLKEPT